MKITKLNLAPWPTEAEPNEQQLMLTVQGQRKELDSFVVVVRALLEAYDRTGPRKLPRGACPQCGRVVSLTIDGQLYMHRPKMGEYTDCPGSGDKPSPTQTRLHLPRPL